MGRVVRQLQTNFTAGQLDPDLFGRMDARVYYAGAARLSNYWVIPQGGARRRPGLAWKAELPGLQYILETSATATYTAPSGGDPLLAIDGNIETTLDATSNAAQNLVLVHVDLGSVKGIARVDVANMFLQGSGNFTSTGWEVQWSTDNAAWNTLTEIGQFSISTATQGEPTFQSAVSSGNVATARYFRVVQAGPGSTNRAPAIGEFQLYTVSLVTEPGEGRIVPFEFSTTQQYVLALTERAVTIFRGDTYITTILSPFQSKDLAGLNWAQAGDTIIFVHPDIKPWVLRRDTSEEGLWSWRAAEFINVPRFNFTPNVVSPAQTLAFEAANAATGKLTWTLTAGAATWVSPGDIGQIVRANGGIFRVVRVDSDTAAQAIPLAQPYDATTVASGNWTIDRGYEPAWSDFRGWPRTVTFYNQRLVFGGSRSRPTTVWASVISDFFNFDTGAGFADEAIDFSIESDQLNAIVGLYPGRDLQVFTSGAEFYFPQDASTPMSPDTFYLKKSTSRGMQDGTRPAEVEGGTFFIQVGGKAIREFLYTRAEFAYNATNIALLSGAILDGAKELSLRKATATDEGDYLFAVNQDGRLGVCATLRGEEVTAWATNDTASAAGMSPFVSVGPDGNNDADVWAIIRRTIDGRVRLYLERFDATHFLDSSLRFTTGLPTATFAGLEHLEGETLRVYADGAVLANVTVSGGSVTIERPAEEFCELGLDNVPSGQSLPVAPQLPDGSQAGRLKRIVNITPLVVDTQSLIVQGRVVSFTTLGSPVNEPPPVFTGRKRLRGFLGYDEYGQFTWSAPDPGPHQISAFHYDVSV